MFVVGRVLDPQGNPVPNAAVMICSQAQGLGRAGLVEGIFPRLIGNSKADESGRFRLDAARTSSSRENTCVAVALSPGYGTGWVEFDPDANEPAAEIKLRPERVIDGRLFDVQGRPARDVLVLVQAIRRVLIPDSARARWVVRDGGCAGPRLSCRESAQRRFCASRARHAAVYQRSARRPASLFTRLRRL